MFLNLCLWTSALVSGCASRYGAHEAYEAHGSHEADGHEAHGASEVTRRLQSLSRWLVKGHSNGLGWDRTQRSRRRMRAASRAKLATQHGTSGRRALGVGSWNVLPRSSLSHSQRPALCYLPFLLCSLFGLRSCLSRPRQWALLHRGFGALLPR